MAAIVKIVGMYAKIPKEFKTVVNTTSSASDKWETDLSPFFLGPCDLYSGLTSLNMENSWQFSKAYVRHVVDGEPTKEYFDWARAGWNNPRAIRYPMGKGAKPLFSYWNGQKLDYISARKVIYGPLYAEAVQRTKGWKHLVELYNTKESIVLRDYDGYDYASLGMSLSEVLNNPSKKMGHAFVLAMLLTKDNALEQMELR